MNKLAFVEIVLIAFSGIYCSDVTLSCDEFRVYKRRYPDTCTVSNFVAKRGDRVVYSDGNFKPKSSNSGEQKSAFDYIKYVHFANASTAYIPEKLFLKMPSVSRLEISSAGVEAISASDFFGANNLTYIALQSNKISRLPRKLLRSAPKVRAIHLSHNQIESDGLRLLDTFSGNGLETIFLSYNKIKKLDADAADIHSNSSKLKYIHLDNNEISTIDPDAFSHSPELFQIALNDNRIERVECQTFSRLDELHELNLSNNSLSELNSSCLPTRLGGLLISDNNIKRIEMQNWFLFNATNSGLTELVISDNITHFQTARLILRDNAIAKIMQVIGKFENLWALDISGNKVGALDFTPFLKMRFLDTLLLRNCSLEITDYTHFEYIESIYTLDLSYNNLNHIDFEQLQVLEHIAELCIDGNNLTEVNDLSNEIFPNLRRVSISNNPLTCSDITEGLELNGDVRIIDSGGETLNLTEIICIACRSSNSLSADWSLYMNEKCATESRSVSFLFIFFVIGCLAATVVLAVFLLHRNRKIRIFSLFNERHNVLVNME